MTQGKYEEAVVHFTEALRLNPGFANAHNNLGDVLYTQGKNEEAAAHYAEALRLSPDYANAHNKLGAFETGEYRRRRLIHRSRAAQSRSAEAHYNLGMSLARGSTRRPRLISPRRCGSIPAPPMPATA